MSSANPLHSASHGRVKLIWVASDTAVTAPEYTGKSILIDYTKLKDLVSPNTETLGKVLVANQDTLNMAQILVSEGSNPLVLNMASFEGPGGGWRHGATAQEEELFRSSNYFRALPNSIYPLKMTTLVMSPDVVVYKDSSYAVMKDPFRVDMLAVAALKVPVLIGDRYDRYQPEDSEIMFDKIEAMFKIAYENGNDSLILSAFGCGAYCNPSREVALMFKECVKKYRKHFKLIAFGILGDNYTVFEEVLGDL